VLLLLFNSLDSQVFSLLPIDCGAFTLEDFGAFEAERVILAGLAFHFVFLSQNSVRKVVIWRKIKVQSEALKIIKKHFLAQTTLLVRKLRVGWDFSVIKGFNHFDQLRCQEPQWHSSQKDFHSWPILNKVFSTN
jgi:hypothetical protein